MCTERGNIVLRYGNVGNVHIQRGLIVLHFYERLHFRVEYSPPTEVTKNEPLKVAMNNRTVCVIARIN